MGVNVAVVNWAWLYSTTLSKTECIVNRLIVHISKQSPKRRRGKQRGKEEDNG